MKSRIYPLAEIYRQLRPLSAVRTGEFRAPKKGEWYLSGAIPEAYLANNNLSEAYYILKLIRVS